MDGVFESLQVPKGHALLVPDYKQFASYTGIPDFPYRFIDPRVVDDSSYTSFGQEVWKHMQCLAPEIEEDMDFIPATVRPAADTTEKVKIGPLKGRYGSVTDKRVYVFNPWYLKPAASHVMVTNHILNALNGSDAERIILIEPFNPYYSYDARSDRESLGAKTVLGGYESQSGDTKLTVYTFVPHSKQLDLAAQRFIALPLLGKLSDYIAARYNLANLVVCGPDEGSTKPASKYSKKLGIRQVHATKIKADMDDVEEIIITGDVNGNDVLFVDDMTRTAGTLINAARSARKKGARKIYACTPHLSLDYNRKEGKFAKEMLMEEDIQVIGTNSVPHSFTDEEERYFDIMSIVPVVAELITCRFQRQSTSQFFSDNGMDVYEQLGR